MESLIERLTQMQGAYYEFVDSVIDYAESKENHFNSIMDFLDENLMATPSEVLGFISSQPDFFEDDVPADVLVS